MLLISFHRSQSDDPKSSQCDVMQLEMREIDLAHPFYCSHNKLFFVSFTDGLFTMNDDSLAVCLFVVHDSCKLLQEVLHLHSRVHSTRVHQPCPACTLRMEGHTKINIKGLSKVQSQHCKLHDKEDDHT